MPNKHKLTIEELFDKRMEEVRNRRLNPSQVNGGPSDYLSRIRQAARARKLQLPKL